MNIIKLITFFNFFFLLSSCNGQSKQNEEEKLKIDKITLSVVSGAKGGGYSELAITKDSIFYEYNNIFFPQNAKKIERKSPDNLWKKLMDSLTLSDYKLVKSNPGHVQYDGSDATISLHTKEKKYDVINAEDDTINFGKIKYFHTLLKNLNLKIQDGYSLKGKSFSAHIETVCQETTLPDPCAGYRIFLVLKFDELEVEITQQTMSTCGKVEYINKYFSEWDYENSDKIVIKKLVYDKKPIIEKNTLKNNFKEKKLIGISTNKSQEYIFEEVK